MNLGDLLDELRNNILNDRSDLVDGDSDFLWSNATLTRYIDEAQRRFALKTLCLRDGSTNEVTLLTLEEGVSVYTLHPTVLAVVSAKMTDDTADLRRVGHALLNGQASPTVLPFEPEYYASATPGKPLVFSTDEEFGFDDDDSVGVVKLRVYPTPSEDYDGETIRLRVARKPLERLVANADAMVPEIPEEYHMEILDWAAYLALRKVDHDAEDRTRAADFRASFEAAVKQAQTTLGRKLFAHTGWGFGANGWVWGS